jgi:peptide/nickel transport system permease protein
MKLPPLNALIGGALIGTLAVVASIGALWTPYDPLRLSFRPPRCIGSAPTNSAATYSRG